MIETTTYHFYTTFNLQNAAFIFAHLIAQWGWPLWLPLYAAEAESLLSPDYSPPPHVWRVRTPLGGHILGKNTMLACGDAGELKSNRGTQQGLYLIRRAWRKPSSSGNGFSLDLAGGCAGLGATMCIKHAYCLLLNHWLQ